MSFYNNVKVLLYGSDNQGTLAPTSRAIVATDDPVGGRAHVEDRGLSRHQGGQLDSFIGAEGPPYTGRRGRVYLLYQI